ncbi:lipopolysaccharide biosynthesis protein [Pedobacter frigoris]|uniref:lipopolysaccharide biosynthesis protein n=1 Tax=Pedobacter frigoris TaxID=2571272 RepID=UPI00292D85FC|nr:oligosaccharide flippase family protein [Pedobacter frigoris]
MKRKETTKEIGLLKNGTWGIGANVLQLLFVSLFFAIVARKYTAVEFAQFLISTTIYQLVVAFSSMGLGQWFIRKYVSATDKAELTGKFLKSQIGLGFLFYFLNIVFTYSIYPDGQIRILSLILGTNIIFDNLINALRSLNIAEGRQDRTAVIMIIDGFLKLLVGCLLFISPFSVITLAILMIVVRLLTLSSFLKIGSSTTNLQALIKAKLSARDLKILIFKNWRFMVIGSLSILYWRAGNIIISKTLGLAEVAAYEISFRIFSIFQILPIVASATIYPRFVKYVTEKNTTGLQRLYNLLFFGYSAVAILAYAFIFSFASFILPFAFGDTYQNATECLQQMFLAFLIMPTVLLQANLLVALGLERRDMQFNILSLIVNLGGCLAGLYFYKSLSVINYAIFASLIVFHLLQDMVLIKKGIIAAGHCLWFYTSIVCTVAGFWLLPEITGPYLFYFLFSALVLVVALGIGISYKKISW